MSNVFKPLTDKDKVLNRTFQEITPLFGNSVDARKTEAGWTFERNHDFESSPTFTGSVLFVNDNSFYISYANSNIALDNSYTLPWNVLMDTLGGTYNDTNGSYSFEIEDEVNLESSAINEAIIISFNPEIYKQGIDYDNFAIVLSGSTSPNTFTDIGGNGQYDTTNNLVLLPYFVKDGANNLETATKPLTPTYELRTRNSNDVFTFGSGELIINWEAGTTTSNIMGYIYPEMGLVLLFPEQFDRAQITNAIRTGDRTLNSLNSIMFIAGYAEEKVEKRVYFARLEADEFNYSINNTAFKGNERLFDLQEDPRTFPTRIGLYNDFNECLITGFLSKPSMKSELEQLPIKIEVKL
jgi:hypothetical protein